MVVDRLEHIPGKALANIVTCLEMPDADVSERTRGTHMVGAHNMLVHFVEGDWSTTSREEMGEFLGRVIANAARQGVTVEVPIVASQDGPGEPAVLAPNSIPAGSRFATSTESYAAGFPNIPEPQWLLDDADRVARERREQLPPT